MKTLTTEQQQDLQALFEALKLEFLFDNVSLPTKSEIEYWSNELKPKRVRKVKEVESSTS